MKKRIALDIDDVVFPFSSGAIAYVSKHSGKPVYIHELYTDLPGDTESGLTLEEFIKWVNEYQMAQETLDLIPVEGALSALSELSRTYDIYFITSRSPDLERHTKQWFERHISPVLNRHHITFVGNHYTKSEVGTKADVCRDLNAEWLIDDHPKYVEQLRGAKTTPIMFGEYHWNKDYNGDHFLRAKDWNEVLGHIYKGGNNAI